MKLTHKQVRDFRALLFQYFDTSGRHDLPWRLPTEEGFDPYSIVVSELMLQQTQVARVVPKYEAFLQKFPDVGSLADASLGDVLTAWQGLGYNRRAKFLWQAAQRVVEDYGGTFPCTLDDLVKLPGIGKNTAGAVLAYAFNQPAVFVETNVRTVYIHHFFPDAEKVADAEIIALIEQTIVPDRPREFYWGLMDYGTYIKQTAGNASRRSAHHVRQSPFEGSRRQVRGAIVRALAGRGYSAEELALAIPDSRMHEVLLELQTEGMVAQTDDIFHLA